MATTSFRIALGQVNSTVGDFPSNLEKIAAFLDEARYKKADLIAFPELAITGYPPEDLLLKPQFIDDNISSLHKLARRVRDLVAIVGFVDRDKGGIYNAAAVIHNGRIVGIYHKAFLPNYGVFDEKRYFKAGMRAGLFMLRNIVFGVNICEDIWHIDGPTKLQSSNGAGLILNINASPYYAGKIKEREAIVRKQARLNNLTIAYVNLIGGQDELVFDGQSMVVDDKGTILARAKAFEEELLVLDTDIAVRRKGPGKDTRLIQIGVSAPKTERPPIVAAKAKPLKPFVEIYEALRLGTADYVAKNGFKKVIIGLSGGIDSALVAALAADALGEENVNTVFMPSRYSSRISFYGAKKTAENLGINFLSIPIEKIFKLYLNTLKPHFAERPMPDITEENLQARIRGNILMALSNKFGWLVLTTGNKSEMSTGYATLYGDMAGGFAVIKDVPKTLVYKLAKYRNSKSEVFPNSLFTRPPSAELKARQKDSDTLPSYGILDRILKAYVEEDKNPKELIRMGFNRELISRVVLMVDKSEYKRRQSPPGIKITPKAFGRDRRMPITNRYKTYGRPF